MEAIALLLGTLGATGALWAWQNRGTRRAGERDAQLRAMLDEQMQIALHLARHAAVSRHQPLHPLHVLYAIIADEQVAELVRELGGDHAAIEQRLDAAVEQVHPNGDPREGTRMLGTALGLAQAHDRTMTIADALVVLARTPHAKLVETPTASPGFAGARSDAERSAVTIDALVFRVIHGSAPPAATLPNETHVHVVIRNDDFTTQQFVIELLRDVFELGETDAVAKMRATHETGRAIVGRFSAAAARDKIEAARRKAATEHMPLWIGVEVC